MVWDGDKRVLVRTSTTDSIYAVFAYPEMKFLSYTGSLSEYKQILAECNEGFYLVKDDSLYLYHLTDKDLLQKTTTHFLYNSNKIRLSKIKKLNDKMYTAHAYTDPSYNDIRLNEFYMLDAENNILYPKGYYPERTEVRFKTIFDFKMCIRDSHQSDMAKSIHRNHQMANIYSRIFFQQLQRLDLCDESRTQL